MNTATHMPQAGASFKQNRLMNLPNAKTSDTKTPTLKKRNYAGKTECQFV